MSRPKLLKIFEETTEDKAYSRLNNPVTVTKSGANLVVSEPISLEGNTTMITFTAPCECTAISKLVVGEKQFSIVDSLGNTATGTFKGFTANSKVSVLLDISNLKAFILNGAYNYAGSSTPGGSADSATKLSTARTIDGVDFDGSAAISHYATCSTAAATAAKTVTCTGFKRVTGAMIAVRFSVTNTAASPTLNVNSTGATAIRYRDAIVSARVLTAGRTYLFIYNGASYELVGDLDTNTTYSGATTTANGLMTTGAQTFAGAKTFNGVVKVAGADTADTFQVRNIAVGSDEASKVSIPSGALYGMYEKDL